jgi:ABC-type antimicrobial peptide transport system permease subunit
MLGRLWDSDIAYSFRTSPVAVVSAGIALVLILAAVFAPWLAPHGRGVAFAAGQFQAACWYG